MPQIILENLTKEFHLKIKKPGAHGWKSLFQNEKKIISAVDQISFTVDKGETVALIGPNGAGKSTIIKMLTGILFPTSGTASVAGFSPWQERQKMAFKIGTVFGQKSQLSFHLPAIDSFRLFGRIYELDDAVYEKRLQELVTIFNVQEFLGQPLRKLSLGQRMRCEIIASLLHNPEIIFLDEPTIGLDVVAKRELRDVLRSLNKQWNTTIFLTSHDTGDIEALCKRTIIINYGKMIYDDLTQNLQRKYITIKRIYVRFEDKLEGFQMQDVTILNIGRYGVSLEVDTSKRNIRSVLEEIIRKYSIVDINIEDPSLEEIISNIYQKANE
ncbi:MAG: ATP-binding cassette domain-containing protein [bacterium]